MTLDPLGLSSFFHQRSESFLQNLAKKFTLVPSEFQKLAMIYFKAQKVPFHSESLLVIYCCIITPKFAFKATLIISHHSERSESKNSSVGWVWLSVSHDIADKVSSEALNGAKALLPRCLPTWLLAQFLIDWPFPHNMAADFPQNE